MMVKKDLVLYNKIFFSPIANEDGLFAAKILYNCRHFTEVAQPLYYYHETPVSLMRVKGDTPVYSYFRAYIEVLDFVGDWLKETRRYRKMSSTQERNVYVFFLNLVLINLCRVEPMIGDDFDSLLHDYATNIMGEKGIYPEAFYYLYKRLVYMIQNK